MITEQQNNRFLYYIIAANESMVNAYYSLDTRDKKDAEGNIIRYDPELKKIIDSHKESCERMERKMRQHIKLKKHPQLIDAIEGHAIVFTEYMVELSKTSDITTPLAMLKAYNEGEVKVVKTRKPKLEPEYGC